MARNSASSPPTRTAKPRRPRKGERVAPRYTAAELARQFGYADPTVSEWRKNGAPFGADNRISLDELWRWDRAVTRAQAAAKAAPTDVADATRRKLMAEAELAEHKLAVARGEVVPAVQVEAAWARHLAPLRAKISAIPGKWARSLVGKAKPNQAQAALVPLVQELLAVLSAGDSGAEGAA